MCRSSIFLGAIALSGIVLGATRVHADILLDQPHDFQSSIGSDFMGPAGSTQFGDDFRPTGPVILESVTFWMIATWAHQPHEWSIALHRTRPDNAPWGFRPEYNWFFRQDGPTSITDLGQWNGDAELNLYEVRFDDLDLLLDPADTLKGTFWLSSFGHITDRNLQESRWGTSGNGSINGEVAWWRTVPWVWPGWTRWSGWSDLAMRIEGTPVPAPGVMIPLILMATLRRRRRSSIG